MAQYKTFRYGDGTQYGDGDPVVQVPFTGETVWVIQVDWAGTGYGVNEAVNCQGMTISRGRRYTVKPDGSGLEPMGVGSATLQMDNNDRRYDPYNAGSPIYPNVLPGRKITIYGMDVSSSVIEVIFTGHITDIQPSSESNTVTISAEDGMRWLSDAQIDTAAVYAMTTDEAINETLTLAGWPFPRDVHTTPQPIQVFEPMPGDANTLLQSLAESNLGCFFVSKEGEATFFPLSYDTVSTYALDQTQLLKEIRVPQPWETVRNKIALVANRRGKRPLGEIWSMQSIETFDDAEVMFYEANFATADNIAQPVPVTDFTCNSASDGTGTDVSASFQCFLAGQTTTTCIIRMTNNSGAVAYLTWMRLMGRAIATSPETIRSEDSASVSTYGPRRFNLDNPWLQDKAYTQAYAAIVKDFLKAPQMNPIIRIQQRPTIQLAIELLDKINLDVSALGISDTFRVGGIDHEWLTSNGQSVLTTLYLQKVLHDDTAITPDPYYPGQPDIPDLPWPPGTPPYLPPYDPWLPPYDDPPAGGICLDGTYQTGEFACLITGGYDMDSQITTELFIWYPCTLRPGNVPFPSYLILPGYFYSMPAEMLHVDAIDGGGNVLVSGVVHYRTIYIPVSDLVADFRPSIATEVAGFRLWITPTSGGYIIGDEISRGTLVNDDGHGTNLVATVHPGIAGTFAITTYDGPEISNWGAGNVNNYALQYVPMDAPTEYYYETMGGMVGAAYISPDPARAPAGYLAAVAPYNGYYIRFFMYKLSWDHIRFRVYGSNYEWWDRGGSLGWICNECVYGSYQIRFRYPSLMNICQQ